MEIKIGEKKFKVSVKVCETDGSITMMEKVFKTEYDLDIWLDKLQEIFKVYAVTVSRVTE